MKSYILFWTITEINKGENIGRCINFDQRDSLKHLVWSLSDSGEFYHEWCDYKRPRKYL